jgi:hypothetical protein
MTRNKHSFISKAVLAVALAAGVAGIANADDSSMNPITGDSYRYFASQPIDKAGSVWRKSHPNGLTEQDVQAVASSDLSAFVARVDPPAFATAAADPSWRETHPNGLTEQELMVLSSNSVSRWRSDLTGNPAPSFLARSPGNTKVSSYQ